MDEEAKKQEDIIPKSKSKSPSQSLERTKISDFQKKNSRLKSTFGQSLMQLCLVQNQFLSLPEIEQIGVVNV